jgi:hypothetical protein
MSTRSYAFGRLRAEDRASGGDYDNDSYNDWSAGASGYGGGYYQSQSSAYEEDENEAFAAMQLSGRTQDNYGYYNDDNEDDEDDDADADGSTGSEESESSREES